jgi:hypothetical protein
MPHEARCSPGLRPLQGFHSSSTRTLSGPSSFWLTAPRLAVPQHDAISRLDALEVWLGSPEPAAPPEVSHLLLPVLPKGI